MNRTLAIVAAIVALTAAPVMAAGYNLDAKGNCHDARGKFAKKELCAPPPKHCRDAKSGRFAKCSAPGAIPS